MPKDFGIMGIVMMLIGYTNLITNFGFGEAIIQKNIHDKKTLNSIFTFNITISTLLAVGFYISAGFIGDFFHTPECKMAIRVMSLVFIITSFPVIPGSILRRDMNFKTVASFDLIESILMSVITLFLAYKGFGYWALVYGQLIPVIVITVLLCIKVRYFPFLYYSHTHMRDIYNFGGWNFFKTQLGFISQHVDIFIIGKWLGPVCLGYYDKAMSIGMVPLNSLTMNINSVMFSSFSLDKEHISVLQRSFIKGLALVSLINYPIYFGLIAVAPYFTIILLGNKWSPMIVPFQIILFGIIFKANNGLIASLNIGIGNYKNHSLRLLFALIIYIVSCLLLLKIGLNGIALAFCIFCIVQFILSLSLAKKAIDLSWIEIMRALSGGFVASLIMFFTTIIFAKFIFNSYTIINLVVLIFSGICCYIICLLLQKNQFVADIISSLKKDILLIKDKDNII